MANLPGREDNVKSGFAEFKQAFQAGDARAFQVEAEVSSGQTSSAVLQFEGSLTNRDARVLKRLLGPLNRRPVEMVILDLTGIVQIDSTPLAALLMFVKEREPMQHALACALVLNGPTVLEKIKTLGLMPLFEIFESLKEARYNLGLDKHPAGNGDAKWPAEGELNMTARVKLITASPRTAIVTLAGFMQEKEAEYLSWILRQVGRRGARHVIIDVSGISYANSPALGVLVSTARIWQEAYEENCVALAGPDASLIRTLKLLGVERLFTIASTVRNARDALMGDSLTESPRTGRRPSRQIHRQ